MAETRGMALRMYRHRVVLMIAMLALVPFMAAPAAARVVTDATGRQVEIPDRVERIYPAGSPAAVLLYTLVPEKMLGWPHHPAAAAQPFLKSPYGELPELKPLMRDGEVDKAMIAAVKPDLIIDYGSVTPRYLEMAKRVQAETGIPYLLLDGRLERTAEIYRLLGPVVGAATRGEELAVAADRFLALNRDRASTRAAAGPLKVYYSRSADGLTTASQASTTTDVLRLVGLINLADETGSEHLTKVSREQVLAWKPGLVLAAAHDFGQAFATQEWAELPAVRNHRIYIAPRPPFGWIDEPPSVNRLIGLVWAGKVLYPSAYPEDLRREARDFYHRFYQVDLTEAQLDQLLQ